MGVKRGGSSGTSSRKSIRIQAGERFVPALVSHPAFTPDEFQFTGNNVGNSQRCLSRGNLLKRALVDTLSFFHTATVPGHDYVFYSSATW